MIYSIEISAVVIFEDKCFGRLQHPLKMDDGFKNVPVRAIGKRVSGEKPFVS
jgi:hypothetical protein